MNDLHYLHHTGKIKKGHPVKTKKTSLIKNLSVWQKSIVKKIRKRQRIGDDFLSVL
jgi:hypothetical protein